MCWRKSDFRSPTFYEFDDIFVINLQRLVLSAQKELGAHLWICFTPMSVLFIFFEIFFSDFFRSFFFDGEKIQIFLWKNLGRKKNLKNFRRKKKSIFFRPKIKSIYFGVKHIQRRAPNSVWARRTISLKLLIIRRYRCICPPPSDPFGQKVRGGQMGSVKSWVILWCHKISPARRRRDFFPVLKANSPLEIVILWYKKCIFFAPAAGLIDVLPDFLESSDRALRN